MFFGSSGDALNSDELDLEKITFICEEGLKRV